ncbi:MAG: hypothetical protein F7B59_07455 [Desulfurococcales archaeon]|nr:hypothetical protein [Desulfurococcales archaeon]
MPYALIPEFLTGKLIRCLLYNKYTVKLLFDPVLGDSPSTYHAKSLSRTSDIVFVGEYLL